MLFASAGTSQFWGKSVKIPFFQNDFFLKRKRQKPQSQMKRRRHPSRGAAPRYSLLLSLHGRNGKHLSAPSRHNHLTAQEKKKGKIREIGPSSGRILSLTSRRVSSASRDVFIHRSSLCWRLYSHFIYDNCLWLCQPPTRWNKAAFDMTALTS